MHSHRRNAAPARSPSGFEKNPHLRGPRTVARPFVARSFRAALATLGLLTLGATAQEALLGQHVQGLLQHARAAHPELASLRAEAEAAQQRVPQATALPDPRLRLEWQDITRGGSQAPTVWPSRTGGTRYLLTQEVPGWGKRALRREAAESEAQAAQSRTEAAWADLAWRIKTAHAQLYLLNQTEAQTQASLALLDQLEKIALARYSAGLGAQQDVLRTQTERTLLQTERLGLQGDIRQTTARINHLLARPMDAPLDPVQFLRPLPAAGQLAPEQLEARLQAHNPQLAVDAWRIQAAEKNRALARKNGEPDLTLGLAPTQNQGAFKTWDLMLELSLPLQTPTRRAQEREAEALLAAARARQDASLHQALAELSEQLNALHAAQQSADLLATRLLPQTELTLQAALAGYESGKLDFASVIEAQRQIRQARIKLIQARADTQLRLAQVERLLGEDL